MHVFSSSMVTCIYIHMHIYRDLNTVSNTVEYVYYLQDDSTSDPHSHTLSRAEVTNLANKQSKIL